MEEVALCFRFMDLLLHDLVGEGMEEEISCWPLRLLGTEPPPEQLPFIPPGNGIPLNASLSFPLAYCRGLLLSMLLKLWLRRLRLEDPELLEAPLPAAGTLEGPGNLDCMSAVRLLEAEELLLCWLSSTRDWKYCCCCCCCCL